MGYRIGKQSPTAAVNRTDLPGLPQGPCPNHCRVSTLKTIENLARRARYARRALLADPPGGAAPLVGKWLGRRTPIPGRIVVDPSRNWNGLPQSDPLSLDHWQEILLATVEWLGPLPVTFLSRSEKLSPLVPDLIRFTNRLECAVSLYGVDGGIDEDLALQLVDEGLGRACLVLGGVTPDLHAEVSGRSVGRTTAAVSALVRARELRRVVLDVVVDFPCTPSTAKDLEAVLGWAQQAGADGFAVSPPFLSPAAPVHLADDLADRVAELESAAGAFHRTAKGTVGALRATWAAGDGGPGGHGPTRCPVAGLRLDIRGCGRFGSCPFHRSMGRLERGADVGEAWARSREHFEAVRSCARFCRHQELVPPGLAPPWSPR